MKYPFCRQELTRLSYMAAMLAVKRSAARYYEIELCKPGCDPLYAMCYKATIVEIKSLEAAQSRLQADHDTQLFTTEEDLYTIGDAQL